MKDEDMSERFDNLSDEELAERMSKRLIWLEEAYAEAASRADAVDQTELGLGFKGIHYALKSLHCEADILGNKAIGRPLTRAGER